MSDDIAQAEKRGYAKGYAAGKRRKEADRRHEHYQRKRDANWNRAFLAALPAAIAAEGWTIGDKPINTLAQRVKLAADFADESAKHMRLP